MQQLANDDQKPSLSLAIFAGEPGVPFTRDATFLLMSRRGELPAMCHLDVKSADQGHHMVVVFASRAEGGEATRP